MIVNFADSYYYLALVNERDAGHEKALEFSRRYRGQTVTTEWVLIEVADALSTPELRPIFLDILGEIENNPGLTVVEASHQLFNAASSYSLADPIKRGPQLTASPSW